MSRPILITGCSSGIGRAAALRLVRDGWTVYATARRVEALEPLREAGCRVLPLDVTDEESRRAAVDRVTADEGFVWGLVNNAGFSQSGPIEDVPLDLVRRQFETNVFGTLRLTQLVLPGMRARGEGRIVTVGSMGGRLTFPGGGIYHATKYALESITDALRYEVAGFGIRVVLVQPGLVRTAFGTAAVDALRPVAAHASPYAPLNEAVARLTVEVYRSGALAPLAGSPEQVADVIARALRSPHPRPRYRVTASAHVLMALRSLLGDRGWDWFLKRSYPQPGGRNR